MVSVAYDTKTGKIATGMVNGEIKIWNLSKSGGALIATLISHTVLLDLFCENRDVIEIRENREIENNICCFYFI